MVRGRGRKDDRKTKFKKEGKENPYVDPMVLEGP